MWCLRDEEVPAPVVSLIFADYLRHLTEPIIPSGMRGAFVMVNDRLEEGQKVPTLRGLVLSLEPINRVTLQEVLHLIYS